MASTRRTFLTGAGAAAAQGVAHGQDHEHQAVPSDPTLRVKALESLLVEKGLVDRAALDLLVDRFEHKVGPRDGVARGGTRLGGSRLQETSPGGCSIGHCGTRLHGWARRTHAGGRERSEDAQLSRVHFVSVLSAESPG